MYAGVEEAGVGVEHDAARAGESSACGWLGDDLDIVAHTGQCLDRLRIDPVVDEGFTLGSIDARRRDRLLNAHPEVDDV